jgi:hypothetical protein
MLNKAHLGAIVEPSQGSGVIFGLQELMGVAPCSLGYLEMSTADRGEPAVRDFVPRLGGMAIVQRCFRRGTPNDRCCS